MGCEQLCMLMSLNSAYCAQSRVSTRALCACRDLRLRALDTVNNVWQADGDMNTALQLHTVQHCSRSATETGGSLQCLGQWALDNQPLLQSMQTTVQQLMAA